MENVTYQNDNHDIGMAIELLGSAIRCGGTSAIEDFQSWLRMMDGAGIAVEDDPHQWFKDMCEAAAIR